MSHQYLLLYQPQYLSKFYEICSKYCAIINVNLPKYCIINQLYSFSVFLLIFLQQIFIIVARSIIIWTIVLQLLRPWLHQHSMLSVPLHSLQVSWPIYLVFNIGEMFICNHQSIVFSLTDDRYAALADLDMALRQQNMKHMGKLIKLFIYMYFFSLSVYKNHYYIHLLKSYILFKYFSQ